MKINGAARTVPAGMSLRQVLEWLEVETERVAVELNRAIVRKADWEKAPVEAGAEIEIVMFVGGGRR